MGIETEFKFKLLPPSQGNLSESPFLTGIQETEAFLPCRDPL